MKNLFWLVLFGISLHSAQKSHNSKNEISSTFGKISKSTIILSVDSNKNFANFLEKFSSKSVLKAFSNRYLGYSTLNSIFVFDNECQKILSLSLGSLNRTDKIQCFSFNSKYFFVKLRRSFRIFDINGHELASYNFANKEVSGMDIFVDEHYFYLVSHNKEIFAFKFDSKSRNISLIFHTNDFYSSRPYKFSFVVQDYIYILSNKRFSVVHKRSGKVLKNIYFDIFFDNLLLLKNSAFMYSKARFALIDLLNYEVKYSDTIDFFSKSLMCDPSFISFDGKSYYGKYIFTFFFRDIFFRYAENTYDSLCFLIKNGKVSEFLLQNFAISHVFCLNNALILVDVKAKKFKLI